MQISVGGVFPQVFLIFREWLSAIFRVCKYNNFKFLARSDFNPIHGLRSLFSITMSVELNHCVTFIHACNEILGQFDLNNFSEWIKKLFNLFLIQHAQCSC